MKRTTIFILTAFFGLMLGAAAMAAVDPSMDPLKVAPDMYKLKFENERVRVMEVTFAPGQEIAKHSHPDHFVYVEKGGSITMSHPDGTSAVIEAKEGEIMWINAETHWAKNTGTTEVKLLVTELKEPKPAAAAAGAK